jgi:hypothetical protein
MSCDQCDRDKTQTLIDNRQVCSWCEHWRMECEARWILKTYPTTRRSKHHPQTVRDRLDALAGRGSNHLQQLRQVMASIYRQGRK